MKVSWSQKLLKLSLIDLLVWFEAALLLGFARFLIWALPLKYWVRLIGCHMSTSERYKQNNIDERSCRRIAWAIKSAAYRVPWQAVCLPQAMAAKWMLGFRAQPSKLSLGLRARPDKNRRLAAHAWLECGQTTITGQTADTFTHVSHFI